MNNIDFITIRKSSLFNVLMFSSFWALQIFITKLGFNSGAQVLSFQLLSILIALVILVILISPKYGTELGIESN